MKIGVISDTHLTGMPEEAIPFFKKLSKDVDFLLHAGDFGKLDFFIELKDIFQDRLFAVRGNMDTDPLASDLPEIFTQEIDGLTLSMTHSSGAPNHARENAWKAVKNTEPDIVVFGHSHHPYNKYHENILFFNQEKLFFDFFTFLILNSCGIFRPVQDNAGHFS